MENVECCRSEEGSREHEDFKVATRKVSDESKHADEGCNQCSRRFEYRMKLVAAAPI